MDFNKILENVFLIITVYMRVQPLIKYCTFIVEQLMYSEKCFNIIIKV
jgi:hypothetical protein